MDERLIYSPAQCRAARGLLAWSQDKTALAAGLSYIDFNAFECEMHEIPETAAARLYGAFWQAGVSPIPQGETGPGVRYLSHHPEAAIVSAARADPAAGPPKLNFPRPLFRAALGLLRWDLARVAQLATLSPERVNAFATGAAVLTLDEMTALGAGVIKAGVIATVRRKDTPGVRLARLQAPPLKLAMIAAQYVAESEDEDEDEDEEDDDEDNDGPAVYGAGLGFGR